MKAKDELVTIKELDSIFPTEDNFSDGVYARTIFMPKGTYVCGKKHKTRHLNFVMTGKAKLWMEGDMYEVEAPLMFESKEGCRKVLYIEEDMHWTTVHVTEETDVSEIEKEVIVKETPEEAYLDLKEKGLLAHQVLSITEGEV
jgi:hypothetical protein